MTQDKKKASAEREMAAYDQLPKEIRDILKHTNASAQKVLAQLCDGEYTINDYVMMRSPKNPI